MHELGSGMAADLAEQPTAVEQAILAAENLAPRLSRPQGITVFGRGTSENAAQFGCYLFEALAGVPARVASPSLATLYRASVQLDGWLAIGVSQSGQTQEIVDSLRWASDRGAMTMAVTNARDSALADDADLVLPLGAGPERAVAATKTFSAECAALAALATTWAGARPSWLALTRALEHVAVQPQATRLVSALASAELVLVLGRGLHVPMARELALKTMEGCGTWAVGSSWADLMHGPITALPQTAATIAFPGSAATSPSWKLAATRLKSAGVSAVELEAPFQAADLPWYLQPLVDLACGQVAVLWAARRKGVDPDRPAGLTKVTQT